MVGLLELSNCQYSAYTTKQTTTMMMGRPTQRRHSSTSTSRPAMPSTTWNGSMRAPISRMSVTLNAKYMNDPKPIAISTKSYHGMWLTLWLDLRAGYIMKPMTMTNARKRARRASACSVENSVMNRQYTENTTMSVVTMTAGMPSQMRVLDSLSYLRITSSASMVSSTSTPASISLSAAVSCSLILRLKNAMRTLLYLSLVAVDPNRGSVLCPPPPRGTGCPVWGTGRPSRAGDG